MEYTVNELAKMSGVSTRTLRYYDEIALLKPAKLRSNGYRIYGDEQVDTLQQILFYRELGVSLHEIRLIMQSPDFDVANALQAHLETLTQKRGKIDLLIKTVSKTIQAMKGEIIMTDAEKFEGFKQNLINENEAKYGEEIREKYGADAVNASNARMMGLTSEQYAEIQQLSEEFNKTLKVAFEQGDPASEVAQTACDLHRQWLSYFWGQYTKEAHMGIAQMYVDDPRFTAYYDKIAPNCTGFLRDAINIYCAN